MPHPWNFNSDRQDGGWWIFCGYAEMTGWCLKVLERIPSYFVSHKPFGSKYTGHLKAFFVLILVCSFQGKLNILLISLVWHQVLIKCLLSQCHWAFHQACARCINSHTGACVNVSSGADTWPIILFTAVSPVRTAVLGT